MLEKRYSGVVLGIVLGLAFASAWSRQESNTTQAAQGGIEGIARTPDGLPLEGALIAANRAGASAPVVITRSGKDGRFHIEGLIPAEYGITATAFHLVGAFQGGVKVVAGQTVQGIALKLGQGGVTVSGVVQDVKGRPLPSAQIEADRYSLYSGERFYVYADESGHYTITLPKAVYALSAKTPGYETETKSLLGDIDREADFSLAPPGKPGPAPREVTAWLKEHAIPLQTVEAEHGFADMRPLKEAIDDAQIVSLGEATHGTREFFQLKHRMLEFLVTEMGFTVFAIEASWPESLAVNDYVLNGKGDPARALSGMYFWTWDTEEVLEMIRWMRRYNEDSTHVHKIKFYGFDMQFPCVATRRVLTYLEKVDPEYAPKMQQQLAPIANEFLWENYSSLPENVHATTSAAIAELLKHFEQNRQTYVGRSSEEEWVLAQHHAQIVSQWNESVGPESVYAVRDRAMAENIEWVRHHEGPGTRIVVWAHNGHVEAASDNLGLDTMGTYLRRREGSNMVIFGFAFDEGSFQSIEMPFVTNKPPRQFTLGPAPEGSLDATLAGTGLPIYAVDLRLAPKVGPVADWLELRHTTRSIGSGFAMQAADQFLEPIRVANKYDAILYVKSTTAARPTPTVLRRVPFEKRPSPANLGLEEGDLGHTPAGWWSNTRAGYHAELADHDPKQGKRCAVIRHVEDTGVAGYGTLAQKVDAAHYRDKRVRVRGAVRTDFAHPSDQAYLWLRVEGVGGTPQEAHSAFSGPISTAGWQYFEVLQDVPKDADAVSFGLAMTGQGRAWLDDVSLEIVGNATPVVPVAGIPK